MNERKIILASASPRRSELLKQIGIGFEVIVSDVEEVVTTSEPEKIVCELSGQKARAVYEKAGGGNILVIGADTVVAADGQILGKPRDQADAGKMLRMLSGREHDVYTGVTFVYQSEKDRETHSHTFYECTKVRFLEMTDDEIREYVETEDPLDKAGAYGIQGFCARYIAGINGDYNNVVGLPASRVYQELKRIT